MYAWGKKRKNVSFYRGVCMCKGKTNTLNFTLLQRLTKQPIRIVTTFI